jgi:hypothetical protein
MQSEAETSCHLGHVGLPGQLRWNPADRFIAAMSVSRCVYTALIGNYERLNEQPVARTSELQFICLTDAPQLRSDTWQVRLVKPTFTMDPIRSQRDLKIRPHVHLGDFDQSLYIDNSVILKETPESIFGAYFGESKFSLPKHSFRDRLIDEFIEVSRLGLDDAAKIFEQLNHYVFEYPEILNNKPYWSAILLRDHSAPAVRLLGEIWFAHVLRYSRRDQLSIQLAFRHARLEPDAFEVDNNNSWFHVWPHIVDRDRDRWLGNAATSFTPLVMRLRQTERAGEEAEARSAREKVRADQAETELEGMRLQLAEIGARRDEWLQRYELLRKRSVLRLPRWLVHSR